MSAVLERWRDHRLNLEINFFGGRPPQVSHGEFLILAAVEMMMATLDDVLAKVADENSIEQSLSTLLDGVVAERDALKAQVLELQTELTAAGQDTSKVQSILDAIDSNESLLNVSRRKLMAAVTGGTGSDTSTGGGTTTSTLSGGQGDDTVSGGDGSDTTVSTVAGGNADDTLSGGQGEDSVGGADTSTDTTAGGQGDDSIAGGNADDSVSGGQGDDSIV